MSDLELKDAVKEILVASGQYGQLQAEMRAVVYDNLVKSGETEEKPNDKRPASCKLVETLIMEYLQWRRCPHTQHIFQSEANLTDAAVCRPALLQELQVIDTSHTAQLPLLIGIVEHFKNEQTELSDTN